LGLSAIHYDTKISVLNYVIKMIDVHHSYSINLK
jgi:hypothetical protein